MEGRKQMWTQRSLVFQPHSDQSQDRLIESKGGEHDPVQPAELMALRTEHRHGPCRCSGEEANVQVQVLWLRGVGRYRVDVEVNDLWRDPLGAYTTLLDQFSNCYGAQVALAITVPTKLEPETQLLVVVEQDLSPGFVCQQYGGGQVPL